MPGLAADLQPPAARAGRPHLHRPPQRAPTTPLARPAAAAAEAATNRAPPAEPDRTARPARRPAPRVLRDRRLSEVTRRGGCHASPQGPDSAVARWKRRRATIRAASRPAQERPHRYPATRRIEFSGPTGCLLQ
jgi:hypothetical protein